jgi:hypothetical protein
MTNIATYAAMGMLIGGPIGSGIGGILGAIKSLFNGGKKI